MCQLFISKDFETALLTLLGLSLVLWRRKADNAHGNPLFYGPSPLNSQHLHFQFPITSLLKIFVRSCRDWEKKCREGSRQYCIAIHIRQKPKVRFQLNTQQRHCTNNLKQIFPEMKLCNLIPNFYNHLSVSDCGKI
jgi:hypothetical protein